MQKMHIMCRLKARTNKLSKELNNNEAQLSKVIELKEKVIKLKTKIDSNKENVNELREIVKEKSAYAERHKTKCDNCRNQLCKHGENLSIKPKHFQCECQCQCHDR